MLTLRTVGSLEARFNCLAGRYRFPLSAGTPGGDSPSDGEFVGVSSLRVSGFSTGQYASMKGAVSQERMRLR